MLKDGLEALRRCPSLGMLFVLAGNDAVGGLRNEARTLAAFLVL